jgi:hypothetical protein
MQVIIQAINDHSRRVAPPRTVQRLVGAPCELIKLVEINGDMTTALFAILEADIGVIKPAFVTEVADDFCLGAVPGLACQLLSAPGQAWNVGRHDTVCQSRDPCRFRRTDAHEAVLETI